MSDDEYFGRPQEGPPTDQSLSTQNEETETESIDPSSVTAHLTLVDIERLTGISYVTLQRYAQSHNDRLPHEGTGRNRRYYPAAVEEFQRIKAEIAERRKGAVAGAEAATGAGTEQRGSSASPRAKKKRGRKKRAPKKAAAAQSTTKGAQTVSSKAAAAQPKPEPSSAASSDLDRLARAYQLSLQLKTLDAVREFVSEWRAKLEAELATLKGI